MRFVVGYVLLCLLGLVGGLLLDGAGIRAGGWLAIVAGIALVPFFVPMPEREDLPLYGAAVVGLVVVLLVLRAVDAPDWVTAVAGLAVVAAVLLVDFRRDDDRTGRIRVPPGHRFGSRKR
ncbi:MAG: hypothetical protein ACJ762_06465 [Solirubrobacteraceae bacterium]